jgi:hypothetical protein
MKISDFALVFSNPDEIDSFLNAILLTKIKDFMNKPDKKELFKD